MARILGDLMALDAEDEKKITALFVTLLASEETGKMLGKHVGTAITGLKLDDKLGALEAKLTEATKPKDPPKVDPEPPKAGDPKTPSVEDDPAYKRSLAKLAELEKQAEKLKQQAEASEAARKAELLKTSVRDALVAAGIDPARVGIALTHLQATGAIKVDDKGDPVWTVKTKFGDETRSPAEGAKEWLATDEGKFFVPPSQKQGTGDGVNRDSPAPRKDGKLDWAQLPSRVNLGILDSLGE